MFKKISEWWSNLIGYNLNEDKPKEKTVASGTSVTPIQEKPFEFPPYQEVKQEFETLVIAPKTKTAPKKKRAGKKSKPVKKKVKK